MFQKFKKGLAALAGIPDDEESVRTLTSMGFAVDQARMALRSTNGNVEQAAELLLASGGSMQQSSANNTYASGNNNQRVSHESQDANLERALQESLQEEELRHIRAAQVASTSTAPAVRSAASVRAGQAALIRAETENKKKAPKKKKAPPANSTSFGSTSSSTNGNRKTYVTKSSSCSTSSATSGKAITASNPILEKHHPDVKVPKKLEEKSKEEQIVRCADRLKVSPRAVDTLYLSLTALQKNPDNDKYRKIDKTTAGYQRSLASAPGAEDMLKAMNFRDHGPNTLVLLLPEYDHALLYLGISALEETRKKSEYKDAKRKLQFEREMESIKFSSDSSEQEAIKRAEFMAKCPTEPSEGRGALMQVVIANETVKRRFDGDDTFGDVLNWLGGHGSVIPDKLLNREWSIVDLNRYPLTPIDCETNQNYTLQYIGCWPSGRLEILPTTEEWFQKVNNGDDMVAGASRGLGSIDL